MHAARRRLAEFDGPAMIRALDAQRAERGLSWTELAHVLWNQSAGEELDCSPNRVTNLKTARLADMALTMRATQSIARPAAAFVHPARW